ncbi:MAG TPA: glycosyltransferase family 2 protein [Polyangiaceae bacterium]
MIAAILPALDEQESIGYVVGGLEPHVDAIVVVDNGSRDATAHVAAARGAVVVSEPRRGYGYACLAGIGRAKELGANVVLLLDADGSDDPDEAPRLLRPVLDGEADLVLGVRTGLAANRSHMVPVQRFGNWFAPWLMRLTLGATYRDMPPYKAVRLSALDALALSDTGYGFTIELLVRAHASGLRITQIDVSCRPRIGGQSKVSGTVGGSIKAASKIVYTIGKHAILANRPGG